MSKIYIVFESWGEWEDYKEKPLISFKDRDKAEEYKNSLEKPGECYSEEEFSEWIEELEDIDKYNEEPYLNMDYSELILLEHPELDKEKLENSEKIYYQCEDVSFFIEEIELIEE